MTFVILGIFITVVLALTLRCIFRMKGSRQAIFLFGIWPPVIVIPLMMLVSLASLGESASGGTKGDIGDFAGHLDFVLTLVPFAGLWFLLGVLAFVGSFWLPRRK
jgi:hypothetical protein